MRAIKNRAALVLALTAMALASCHRSPAASNDTAITLSNSPQPALPEASATPVEPPAGPEVLSTVGSAGGAPPLTRVVARQGTFAIQKVDGVDTLTVDGKPTSFKEDGADAPEPVAANDGISLVGVFELPQESVAWVTIIGGTACPASHVLVGARSGIALPGQSILGCGESGTMRREGDKITFEAGGSSGTYKDGVITTTTKPAGWGAAVVR